MLRSPNWPSTSRVSLRTSWSWSARVAIFTVLPSREKIDSATLSNTERPSNRLTIWKLRAIPALMRSATVAEVMSRSSSRIWPLSGCRCALIRLTSVVLPAPLDPTSDRNSPLLTTKSKPSQARVSPKYFRRFTVLSRITSGLPSCQPLTQLGNGADDAGRQYQHQGDENHAEQQLPIFGRGHRVGLELGEDDAADDRPGEIAEAAEQRREHDLAGERRIENVG